MIVAALMRAPVLAPAFSLLHLGLVLGIKGHPQAFRLKYLLVSGIVGLCASVACVVAGCLEGHLRTRALSRARSLEALACLASAIVLAVATVAEACFTLELARHSSRVRALEELESLSRHLLARPDDFLSLLLPPAAVLMLTSRLRASRVRLGRSIPITVGVAVLLWVTSLSLGPRPGRDPFDLGYAAAIPLALVLPSGCALADCLARRRGPRDERRT